MQQDFLLIITHPLARIEPLIDAFNYNAQTVVSPYGTVYQSVMDLLYVKNQVREASLIVDVLYHNHSIQTKSIYDICKFLYFVDKSVSSSRLQRMATMPAGILLMAKDLASSGIALSEALGLRQPLIIPKLEVEDYEITNKYFKKLEAKCCRI